MIIKHNIVVSYSYPNLCVKDIVSLGLPYRSLDIVRWFCKNVF